MVQVALSKVLMRDPTFRPQIYKLNYLCTHGRFLSEVVLSNFFMGVGAARKGNQGRKGRVELRKEGRVMIFPTGGVGREEGEELHLGRKGSSWFLWVHDS